MVVIGGTVTFGEVGGGEENAVDDMGDVVDSELRFEDYSVVHSKNGTRSLYNYVRVFSLRHVCMVLTVQVHQDGDVVRCSVLFEP
jgi:hypothetical protein